LYFLIASAAYFKSALTSAPLVGLLRLS
jgi:hypothetical protein